MGAKSGTLYIRLGLGEEAREAAGELYWEGFSRKLAPVVGGGEPARLLGASLVPERVLGAWDGDRLVGIAALRDADGSASVLDGALLRRAFGPLRGTWRSLLARFLDSAAPGDGELLLEILAVSPAARGLGVGTALLGATAGEARRRGLRRVRLEVIDTNPRAKALYERFGFRVERTVRTPYLSRLLGFAAVDSMVYDLPPGE
ncbi:GNAT family N-acetyltransferase [Actinomadura parmotrematis]|uniref:GNAT family N-acetyltransferase n=1 Tax=Actinomadura parmotrematis TaxID=2864039 RepID=A0ABS7FN57_9ACTN|nr:GNAT family N-acetyltransferase [Actinomadura parmotrematis]MBW8481786.1 GNAT family N-acetyltransferase [Actinomadura parmotrematis]